MLSSSSVFRYASYPHRRIIYTSGFYVERRNHAGFTYSWPEGISNGSSLISDDELARGGTHPVGPFGKDIPSQLSGSATNVMVAMQNDRKIEALDLAVTAGTAAYALKKVHPTVKLTSGRRDKNDQARAMASNVVNNRRWIEQTYAPRALRTKCQEGVDKNADKKTQGDIAEGLLSVLDAATDTGFGEFSKK